MEWSRGYTTEYYAEYVDPVTWRGIRRFEITDGKAVRKETGLRHSADIGCTDEVGDDKWVRLWMNTLQNGSAGHEAIFTGLTSTPSDDIDGYRISYSVQLYSVLRPADKYLLPLGWYAPKGAIGAVVIKDLLSVTPAPVSIEGDSPALAQNIIAENNETALTMVDKVLDAMGWRMVIDGYGQITVKPYSNEPIARYDPLDNDAIEPKISVDRDRYNCPNVFRARRDDLLAIARDDNINSEFSTVNRGYEIWEQELDVSLSDSESIGDYAERKLKELQKYAVSAEYDRRFNPNITVTDVIYMNYPRQKIVGLYRVTNQSIELGHGGRTSEEGVRI